MAAFAGVDTVTLLQSAMRVASDNHRIIAHNIANADTPNYSPVELDFLGTLRATIEGRDRLQLRGTYPFDLDVTRQYAKFKRLAKASKNDYNKVDLEHEMARLSENTGNYTTYSSLLNKHFRTYRDMLDNMR